MGKDKAKRRLTLREGLLQPRVLRVPQSPIPVVTAPRPLTVVRLRHRIPVRIEDHEQRIAPFPGVIVLTQTDEGFENGVAGVGVVRHRVGIELPAGQRSPDGQVVGRAVESPALFALVIAQNAEERRRMTQQAEVRPLIPVPFQRVLIVDRIVVFVLFGEKSIARSRWKSGASAAAFSNIRSYSSRPAVSLARSRVWTCESVWMVKVKVLVGDRCV